MIVRCRRRSWMPAWRLSKPDGTMEAFILEASILATRHARDPAIQRRQKQCAHRRSKRAVADCLNGRQPMPGAKDDARREIAVAAGAKSIAHAIDNDLRRKSPIPFA